MPTPFYDILTKDQRNLIDTKIILDRVRNNSNKWREELHHPETLTTHRENEARNILDTIKHRTEIRKQATVWGIRVDDPMEYLERDARTQKAKGLLERAKKKPHKIVRSLT